MLAYLTYKVER